MLSRANQNWPAENFKPIFPDVSRDRLAVEQAIRELGENYEIRDLLKRAQEIKDGK